MARNTSVMGIYPDRTTVSDATNVLRKAGYRTADISVLASDNQGSKDFAHEKNTKAPEGTAAGAGTGAVVGGTLGLLAGIGALAIPGLGPFIAAGPIMGALAGAGTGGVVGSTVTISGTVLAGSLPVPVLELFDLRRPPTISSASPGSTARS